jgi:autonomous glycyl radical cofactor GrcA
MNGCESIEITQAAQDDLLAAYWFYENQQAGIGAYFLTVCTPTLMPCKSALVFMSKLNQAALFEAWEAAFPLPFIIGLKANKPL